MYPKGKKPIVRKTAPSHPLADLRSVNFMLERLLRSKRGPTKKDIIKLANSVANRLDRKYKEQRHAYEKERAVRDKIKRGWANRSIRKK